MVICTKFETDSCETVLTGDWHIGNSGVNKAALQKMIAYIRKSGCNWIFTGDACESTAHTNKFYDYRAVDPDLPSIGSQYQYLKQLIKPIAPQCIGILSGNHDDRNARISEIDALGDICNDLAIPYLKDSAYCKIKYRKYNELRSTLVYVVHGFTASRKRGGRINALEDIATSHVADLYLCGHTHDMCVTSSIIDTMTTKGNYAQKTIYFGNTGTFLNGHIEGQRSYAEKRGYKPCKIGYLKAVYDPVLRSISMQEVLL
jgi:predicted phosphodiesterase